MTTKILILFLVTITAVGCKTNPKNAEGTKTETTTKNPTEKSDVENLLTEKYWKLAELNGKEVIFQENQRKEAHFILKNDHKLTGNTGCNGIMGTYELLEDHKITFSKIASTMMHCEGVDNEHEFLQVFETMDHYVLKKDTLLFQDENNEVLAKFEAIYL